LSCGFLDDDASDYWTPATPSGYSNLVFANDITANFTVAVATKQIATAGAEDPPEWSAASGSASDSWVGVTVALRSGYTPITITTAKDAPAIKPRIWGSASGLRVTPCSKAPETDRLAPTSSAITARGKRN